MCFYSAKDISKILGVSERTFYNRLAELKKEKKFRKKSKGKFYTPDEVINFASKLGLKITLQNTA
jgi:DeoR/GlpR family transcriptional regulator of sugar metabolism